jgi:hypothetical protein
VAQVCHAALPERALGSLHEHLVLLQRGENRAKVCEVLGPGGAVDEDVVEEHQHEAPEERPEHRVHESLECRWCVGEAERHHQELKEAFVRAEHGLVNVGWVHEHLVVA